MTQPVETAKKNKNAYSYLDSLSIRNNLKYMFTGMRAEMTTDPVQGCLWQPVKDRCEAEEMKSTWEINYLDHSSNL